MLRYAQYLLLSGLCWLATACALPSASLLAPDHTPVAAGTTYTLTELSFSGNGETFLTTLDKTAESASERRFVEVTDSVGNRWQGELLTLSEGDTLFLQQPQQGGLTAVRIDGPSGMTPAAVIDLLPQAAAKPLASPHPDIRFVRAVQDDAAWRFDVTLAYPDTGWEDYADGWHVATPDGAVLESRRLLHPHENEQPFTRSLTDVKIPADVTEILIRSHDLRSGYSPDTLTIPLDTNVETERYAVVRE
ncbi:MAG: hypothetical protein H6642_10665 [Caldilineaceae bacterium]|nr:hypothetical protein [Caldilineaceae bacterium]